MAQLVARLVRIEEVRSSNLLGSTKEGLLQLTSSSMPVTLWPNPIGISPSVSYGDNLHDIRSVEVDELQKVRESSQCHLPHFVADSSEKPRRISHVGDCLAKVLD